MTYEWDENKRCLNLEKHGLDFYDADLVYVYRREIVRVISLRSASSKERSLYYEQTHPPQQ